MATAATAAAAAVPAGRHQHRHRHRLGLGLRPRPNPHRLRLLASVDFSSSSAPSTSSSSSLSTPAEGGGRLVAELVGVFNELTGRMGEGLATTSSSRLLFRALKLALPALRDGDGGLALTRALAVAATLADLQMDAEVMSAGILRKTLDAGTISMQDVEAQIGTGIADLLHESLRLKVAPSKVDVLDDESASTLRKFFLSYYDIRAVILELSLKLDTMRHLQYLPKHLQRIKSLEDISVDGRYKSRFSTMKKLVKDGRKPEEVNDILGLRIILDPRCDGGFSDWGPRACHRTHEIIQALLKEVPGRTKDYVTQPKRNGYQSLHVAIDVSEPGKTRPLMEIQIRTKEMHRIAIGGEASHSLYKGGLTDPGEGKRLKAIMLAAAELAARRLRDLPASDHQGGECKNQAFCLLDKNGDGRISIEELTEVMEDLGAEGADAMALMHLLDANSDGSLSFDEFESFQRQVELMRSLEDRDDHYTKILKDKLQTIDSAGLIHFYRKELGDKLLVS